jgi:carbon monoxide dehydrogenase subunit G
MARYVGEIATPRAPEEVFDYMADFTSVERWDETAVRAVRLDDGPIGLGARFRVTVRFAGRENDYDYETIAYERPTRLVLRAESGSVVSEDEVTVAPDGNGSLLTYDASLQAKGAMKLAEPVLALLFKRLGDNAAAGLARELSGRRA